MRGRCREPGSPLLEREVTDEHAGEGWNHLGGMDSLGIQQRELMRSLLEMPMLPVEILTDTRVCTGQCTHLHVLALSAVGPGNTSSPGAVGLPPAPSSWFLTQRREEVRLKENTAVGTKRAR